MNIKWHITPPDGWRNSPVPHDLSQHYQDWIDGLRKGDKRRKWAYVYLMMKISRGDATYKIGVSRDPSERLKAVGAGAVLYSAWVHLPFALERGLHGLFRDSCVYGEWFNLSSEDLRLATMMIDFWQMMMPIEIYPVPPTWSDSPQKGKGFSLFEWGNRPPSCSWNKEISGYDFPWRVDDFPDIDCILQRRDDEISRVERYRQAQNEKREKEREAQAARAGVVDGACLECGRWLTFWDHDGLCGICIGSLWRKDRTA